MTAVWPARGNAPLAISLAWESIGLEPFHEATYRHLMRAHFEAGDRAEALRTYRRCERLLAHELRVAPHPEAVDLHHQLDGRDRLTPADRATEP